MKLAGIETIIWDLDGTLLNSFDVFAGVLTTVLRKRSIPIPDRDTLLKNFHGSLEQSIASVVPKKYAKDNHSILEEFLQEQDAFYEEVESHLFRDAIELSKRAYKKQIRQIIVTNRNHEGRKRASPKHIVASTNLQDYVHDVICGEDSPVRKPDADVLTKHKIAPQTTIVIGDQLVDAEFARNLGCRGIIVDRHQNYSAQTFSKFDSSITLVPDLSNVHFV